MKKKFDTTDGSRFVVFYKREDGVEENIFKDDRSFKTYKWANTLMNRYSRMSDLKVFMKNVPGIITDTERLDFMIKKEYAMNEVDGMFYLSETICGTKVGIYAQTPREAIDDAISRDKK